MALILPEKEDEAKIFVLQQEIKQQKRELSELVEQDKEESRIIQEVNEAKRELSQAEKELVVYQQKEIDLTKAAERRYATIPSLKQKIQQLEEKAKRFRSAIQ